MVNDQIFVSRAEILGLSTMSYTSLTCVPRARRMRNDDFRFTTPIHGPCRPSGAACVVPTQNFTDVAVTKDSADHMNEDWLLHMRRVELWELWKALLYFGQGLAFGELTSLRQPLPGVESIPVHVLADVRVLTARNDPHRGLCTG